MKRFIRCPEHACNPTQRVNCAVQTLSNGTAQLFRCYHGSAWVEMDACYRAAVHHIDGNPHNNSLANLRIVQVRENF